MTNLHDLNTGRNIQHIYESTYNNTCLVRKLHGQFFYYYFFGEGNEPKTYTNTHFT